ncbi:hypothetical protein KUTeg_009403 [Tegillarca granosa]|uniref:Inosine/uridine-preferring nucleoside hydrolase domain-containing protein n=1 Tax=Tegillarca granosa TaxID=220873 RepID=A0ABQ9F8T8_TEGGR|nr:hypothetical protein KUTeg_009403 [Tegillarca granosa]
MKKKVIIDVDTGVDDAQAIMLALSSDKLEVLAITCVQGNTHIDNVCKNTLKTLKVCNRLDIPVYRGCTKPLTGVVPKMAPFHGEDGLGDAQNPPEVDIGLIQSEHAVLALLRLVNENPGEITLIALAPLTNVAMAIRLDSDLGSKLKEVKIIIDVDTGVDDAQAIMLALTSKEVDVLAITCVQGNADVENVCRNTLRVLKVCDRLDIPVYKGASKPLIGFGLDATHYHGKDGMGDVANPEEVDMSLIQSEPASLALLRLSKEYPGEITLVALAPLTNIALAIRLDPDFGTRLKEMFMMGGNIEVVSIYILLEQHLALLLIFIFSEWFQKWLNINTDKGRFNKSIHKICLPILEKEIEERSYISCDLLTMAVCVDRTVAMETVDKYVTVELTGSITRGEMIVDWRDRLQKNPNVCVVLSYDINKVPVLFTQALLYLGSKWTTDISVEIKELSCTYLAHILYQKT